MNTLRTFACAVGFGIASSALAAPVITNGSLTGTIANGGVPAGWDIVSGSPDTMDQTANVGLSGSPDPFAAGPTASPNGGTWVGIGADAGFIETFGQSVGGFDVGTLYTLSWEHANFGVSNLGYTGANAIEVLIDGLAIGAGPSLSLDRLWYTESITFTATATTHRLDFQLAGSTRSYHSIDGIAISEGGQVPEPGTLALLGLGLAGLAASRRRTQ